MKSIAIYGASGHGKVVAEVAESCGYEIHHLIDDAEETKTILGLHSQPFDRFFHQPDLHVALGIGDNAARRLVMQKIIDHQLEVITLIHPNSTISSRANIGLGSVVLPHVIINTEATIGQGVILNSGCIIEHDCEIGDFTHVSPGAALAGCVKVGENSHIGIHACVIQGITIGNNVTVGAGAVVIHDIPDNTKVVGNPATKYLH